MTERYSYNYRITTTPAEQKAAIAAHHEKFLAWQKDHVLFCEDFPGTCDGSHRLIDLWVMDLKGDRHAFLCDGKVGWNWKQLGFVSNPVWNREKSSTAYRKSYYWKRKLRKP